MTKLLPKRSKTGQNAALGVAGAFFIVPLFFMDFKNAEATEYEAYRQRYNNLATIAESKKCGIQKKDFPSVHEVKKEYESQKKNNSDKK